MVTEGSLGGDLSRDLDELKEASKTGPDEEAFQQKKEPEQGPSWMGLTCLKIGKEARSEYRASLW